MDLAAAIADLNGRAPEHMPEPDLERIAAVCDLLDHPELAYPSIQVTGTNGKSTIARMATSLACAHGLTTGTFTSPHVVSVTERLSVCAGPIPDDEFAEEYGRLLQPIVEGRSSVVFGSRFLDGRNQVRLKARIANAGLTALTNILFGARLTDMETAYKMFRREVVDGIRWRCVAFDFEPEFTAKVLRKGYRILEVPISYHPRNNEEGKKIRWIDGLDAVYVLLKIRFGDGR